MALLNHRLKSFQENVEPALDINRSLNYTQLRLIQLFVEGGETVARDTALKIERIRQGLMAKQVAERVGVSEQYYCAIENGRTPSFRLAMRIAEVLQKPVHDLFSAHEINESLRPTGDTRERRCS